jgi:uncharacterized protein YndB with AHSA1/START domain
MNAVRREVVLPAAPDEVWEAITSPDALREWFGADVAWELAPGGTGRFEDDDGSAREARVAAVEPGRRLGFRWWPEGQEDEASDVDFELTEQEEGTRLVVTETPVVRETCSCQRGWTDWDTRLFRAWAAVGARAALALG